VDDVLCGALQQKSIPGAIRNDAGCASLNQLNLFGQFTELAAGGLYLIAYCHLRREVWLFAVERIRSITLTDHPYQMPLGFNVEEYVQDALSVMRGRRIEVELLFSKTATAWLKDKSWHPSQEIFLTKDGRMTMTLKVADTDELLGWILSFGSQVTVVRPEGLMQKIKDEAEKVCGPYR
jgi:predicted DNA-binding transcriptional regulator YafY